MSLDVYIKYKEPKLVNYNSTHSACGSTMLVCSPDDKYEESEWNANITHNMVKMASNVELNIELTLYDVIWRPEENGINTTDKLLPYLNMGISKMITDRKNLLQYNPENGWGSYSSFLQWLIKYKEACEDNPDCTISTYS